MNGLVKCRGDILIEEWIKYIMYTVHHGSLGKCRLQSADEASDGSHMVLFLGLFHPLRCQHTVLSLVKQEVQYKPAGNRVVELLLLGKVDVVVLGPGSNQFSQGVLVDVVVDVGLHELVEEEEAFGSSPWGGFVLEYFFDQSRRLPRFLNIRKHQTHYIGDYIPVLKLFGLLIFFDGLTIRIIVFIESLLLLQGENLLRVLTWKRLQGEVWEARSGHMQDCGRENKLILRKSLNSFERGKTLQRITGGAKPGGGEVGELGRAEEVYLNHFMITIGLLFDKLVYITTPLLSFKGASSSISSGHSLGQGEGVPELAYGLGGELKGGLPQKVRQLDNKYGQAEELALNTKSQRHRPQGGGSCLNHLPFVNNACA